MQRYIIIFIILYPCIYGKWTWSRHNLVVHGFSSTYIEDMDETIQQYLGRTRESNKKEMIAIIRYLLEGKFDTTVEMEILIQTHSYDFTNSEDDHLYIFCSCFSSSGKIFNIYDYYMYTLCLVTTTKPTYYTLLLIRLVYRFISAFILVPWLAVT